MNMAELERLAGGDQPMGAMDCEEVIKHLARRVIAAEKLVEAARVALHVMDGVDGENDCSRAIDAIDAALTAYGATK